MSGRIASWIGGVLVVLALVLMAIGATVPVFIGYLVLLVAGGALASYGMKREKAETFARLERERRQGR